VLHTMLAKLNRSSSVIQVLCGYRTKETNDALRESGTSNAAEHSQHIEASALDLRVPERSIHPRRHGSRKGVDLCAAPRRTRSPPSPRVTPSPRPVRVGDGPGPASRPGSANPPLHDFLLKPTVQSAH
jgi:hypothetical protein